MTHVWLWMLLIVNLTACHRELAPNEYFCPPMITYDATGTIRSDVYAVNRACYRSMTEKQRACYTDVR